MMAYRKRDRDVSARTTQPKDHPTPKRTKPALQQRVERGAVPIVAPHATRGRRLSAEKIAARRHRARIAKRQRKINRTSAKRRGQIAPLAWLAAFSLFYGAALHYSAPAAADSRDQYVVESGVLLCSVLGDYPNVGGLQGILRSIRSEGFTARDAAWIATVSVKVYCPQLDYVIDDYIAYADAMTEQRKRAI